MVAIVIDIVKTRTVLKYFVEYQHIRNVQNPNHFTHLVPNEDLGHQAMCSKDDHCPDTIMGVCTFSKLIGKAIITPAITDRYFVLSTTPQRRRN